MFGVEWDRNLIPFIQENDHESQKQDQGWIQPAAGSAVNRAEAGGGSGGRRLIGQTALHCHRLFRYPETQPSLSRRTAMKVKSKVKAGALTGNRCETVRR
jgi:hypothetical protein